MLLILPSIIIGQWDASKLIISSKNGKYDCHTCPGYIIIKNGEAIDTLKMGSWGIPPNFKKFNYNKRDFILFETGHFMRGIWESSISVLSINKDDFLNVVFDTLVSDSRINLFKIRRKKIEFVLPNTLLVHSYNEISNYSEEPSKKTDNKKEVIILTF